MPPKDPKSTRKTTASTHQDAAERHVTTRLLFLLSMVTLALQIVQVRVFSYSINPVYVYMVISLALLGVGASATVVSLLPRLRQVPLHRALIICLSGFAASAMLANIVFARCSHLMQAKEGISLLSPIAPIFLLFAVPYFFSGLGVALVLVSDANRVGRNYFVNLVGNGAGCFLIYPFLGELGAEGVTLALLLLAAGAAFFSSFRVERSLLLPTGIVAGLLVVAFVFAGKVLPYQPDSSDYYMLALEKMEEKSGTEVVSHRKFSRWDPVGRVELFEFEGANGMLAKRVPTLFFAQDAGAPSMLFDVQSHPEVKDWLADSSIYGLATSLRPDGEVLVMGLGGGPDLVGTLGAGAGRVTGIEINGGVVELLDTHYREVLAFPPKDSEKLRFVHADGRAYVRQHTDRFDVIQMTGADAYAAGSVSASILSENYLYTVEAFQDYFDALKPDGILAITRFGIEPIKVVTTAITAIQNLGLSTRPSEHVMVARQGGLWVLTLVKKSPFTLDEIAAVREFTARAQDLNLDLSIPAYDVMGFSISKPVTLEYDPGLPGDAPAPKGNLFRAYLDASNDGTLDAALAENKSFDFTPSTDDRPFFLQMFRIEWPSLGTIFAPIALENPMAWSVAHYVGITARIAVIGLLLIVGPLFVFRRRHLRLGATAPLALYFFAIGTGYMFVEIGLMQRFSLFLGHPNFSISTVLFSLLVFSGIGSLVSSKWQVPLQKKLTVAFGVIAFFVFVLALGSADIFDVFLDLPIAARVLITVLMLAPVGFFMGMPLPGVLQVAEQHYPEFSPWALGVNGFASVFGSLATVPLSIAIGFSATFLLGAACYALAWICLALIIRKVA